MDGFYMKVYTEQIYQGAICELKGAPLSCLLVLMSHWNKKKKTAWPSIKTLADMTGYSQRNVIRGLNTLKGKGYIVSADRGQTSNVYTFTEQTFGIIRIGSSAKMSPQEKSVVPRCHEGSAKMSPQKPVVVTKTTSCSAKMSPKLEQGTRASNTEPRMNEPYATHLSVLRSVKGYPNEPDEEEYACIDGWVRDFPHIDVLAEIKKWRDWVRDKPLLKNSRPRLQIRNWLTNAKKYENQGGNGQAKVPRKHEYVGSPEEENYREYHGHYADQPNPECEKCKLLTEKGYDPTTWAGASAYLEECRSAWKLSKASSAASL
jgi:hypothetical protein